MIVCVEYLFSDVLRERKLKWSFVKSSKTKNEFLKKEKKTVREETK